MLIKQPLIGLVAMWSSFATSAPTELDARGGPVEWVNDPNHYRTLALNHLAIASGQYSLVNQTWMPDVHLYQDLLPGTNESFVLPVTNSSAYLGYIEHFRSGFSSYTFAARYWFHSPFKVAIRWTATAIVGANIKTHETTETVPPGTTVVYNGTDILLLDCETGLAYEVDSAFNTLQYEKALGIPLIHITGAE